jgi:hypothetical protein
MIDIRIIVAYIACLISEATRIAGPSTAEIAIVTTFGTKKPILLSFLFRRIRVWVQNWD